MKKYKKDNTTEIRNGIRILKIFLDKKNEVIPLKTKYKKIPKKKE